jgi:hypothetical protein
MCVVWGFNVVDRAATQGESASSSGAMLAYSLHDHREETAAAALSWTAMDFVADGQHEPRTFDRNTRITRRLIPTIPVTPYLSVIVSFVSSPICCIQ